MQIQKGTTQSAILTPVQTRVLIHLFEHSNKEQWISKIAKNTKGTLNFISSSVTVLNHKGLIKTIVSGRKTNCFLTKKGEEVSKLIIKIRDLVKCG